MPKLLFQLDTHFQHLYCAFVQCIMTCVLFDYLQDGLKRRLDKLKKNIEEATAAVDQEREKNVSLLHLIFPPDIAKRLWLGWYFFSPNPI